MTDKSGALVFVTTELYPFMTGGIGRYTYNMLKSLSPHDLRRSKLVLTHGSISRSAFEMLFPGAELLQIGDERGESAKGDLSEQSEDPWFSMSCRILRLLKRESEHNSISYVEFPDWSGLGFATIQERLSRGFLPDATIAVRVHSTEAILALRETRNLRHQDLRRYDLERKCYRDCDLIIAHLQPVAEATRRCFGFSEEEWWPRVLVTPAPVDIGDHPPSSRSILPDLHTPVVFTSKFQEIKNPAVFMQAVAGLVQDNPTYKGRIVLACGGLTLDFAKSILSLVPAELLPRIETVDGRRDSDRDLVISKGIVAFPATFESFCLAAYEASLLGAVVVLNEDNPAFGDDTPWVDGENCLKFDGSAKGLQSALERALGLGAPLSQVRLPSAVSPWLREVEATGEHRSMEEFPLVTAVVVNQNDGALLPDTLESILAQEYPNLEIIIVDDGSRDAFSKIMNHKLGLGRDFPARLIPLSMSVGRGAAMNHGVSLAAGAYVVRIHSGELLCHQFLKTAVSALELHSDFDVYCSQTACFRDIDFTERKDLRFEGYVGEALVAGSHANYFAKGPWVGRRELFEQVPFRTNLGALSDWGWMFDVVARGSRVICSPHVEVLLRDRSLSDAADPVGNPHLLDHLIVGSSAFSRRSFPVADLAMTCNGASYREAGQEWPDWYAHMMENGYEPEMSFVGGVLGHTSLGKMIRTNSRIAGALEKFLRWIARVPPGVT